MIQVSTLTEIESSNIQRIGYSNSNLYIEYKSGSLYEYKDVPEQLYEGLKNAESKGKFINTQIKNQFNYNRII